MTEVDAMAVFLILDEDESGTLSPSEVRVGVKEAFGTTAPPPSKVDTFFRCADEDGSGFIDPDEFAALVDRICQYMRITTNAFHCAITRSEFSRIFEKLSIDETMSRSETEVLLNELCSALDSDVSAAQLLNALDMMSTPDGKVAIVGSPKVEHVTKGDFITLLTELTQGRPSPAVSRTFRQWELKRRDKIKRTKLGLAGAADDEAELSADAALVAAGYGDAVVEPCKKCSEHEASLKRLKFEIEDLQEDLLGATIKVQENRDTSANQAAKEARWNIDLQEKGDRIKELEAQVKRGEKKLTEMEGLNRVLASANNRSTNQLDQTNSLVRNLEERLKISEQEVAYIKAEHSHAKKLNELFSGLDAKVDGLVALAIQDVNQVRSDALDAQANALKQERKKLYKNEIELRLKGIEVDRKTQTAKKVQEQVEDRTTRLAGRELTFEKQQQLAERTSLPEREHRMTRISDLERLLSRRETIVQEKLEEIETKESIISSATTIMHDYERVKNELREARAALAIQIDCIPEARM